MQSVKGKYSKPTLSDLGSGNLPLVLDLGFWSLGLILGEGLGTSSEENEVTVVLY